MKQNKNKQPPETDDNNDDINLGIIISTNDDEIIITTTTHVDYPNDEEYEEALKQYQPLINKLVKQWYVPNKNSLERDDLLQHARIALFNAMKLFDPERQIYFGIYLKQAITNNLANYVRQYQPHHWTKDIEKTQETGKQCFKRVRIYVQSLDSAEENKNNDYNS